MQQQLVYRNPARPSLQQTQCYNCRGFGYISRNCLSDRKYKSPQRRVQYAEPIYYKDSNAYTIAQPTYYETQPQPIYYED